MEIAAADTPLAEIEADFLAIPVAEPFRAEGPAGELDARLDGRLSHLADDGELKGTVGRVTILHTLGDLGAHRVAAVGVGPVTAVGADELRTAAARVAARAAELAGRTVAWALSPDLPLDSADQSAALVDGTVLGGHTAGRWKTNEKGRKKPAERLLLAGPDAGRVVEAAQRAETIARWTNRCRDLVNAPPNELTPVALAEQAAEIAAGGANLRLETMGRAEIESAGMGAFAAVARGADTEPRLIVLSYDPPDADESLRLGLVGKAITFDTGGISIKPSARMEDMKGDMGGGGAVLCGLGAIADLDLPLRVLAVIPACENMPSGRAYRPGDILTASNGKTIEVTNTDAEGRLILADALVHARRQGATHLLDLATLTGAIVSALGDRYAGLMGNDDPWIGQVRAAGETSGDHTWVLPLHETHHRYIRSHFADMKNSSDLRQAIPSYAARFLQEFSGEGPWAHLDIAGTAFLDRSREDYYTSKGATGYGVRLIARLAERLGAA